MIIKNEEIIGYSIGGYDLCLCCLADIKEDSSDLGIKKSEEQSSEDDDHSEMSEEVMESLATNAPIAIYTEKDINNGGNLVCDFCGCILRVK